MKAFTQAIIWGFGLATGTLLFSATVSALAAIFMIRE